MLKLLAPTLVLPALLVAGPAAAAPVDTRTVVEHNTTETIRFDDDVCGPRANTTTFTRKVVQSHITEGVDGSFNFHEVAVVTYVSDYDDADLPDLSGRLTEVNRFTRTPGGTFTGTVTFHDFFGDVRIHVKQHITEVRGRLVVEREVVKVSGCP